MRQAFKTARDLMFSPTGIMITVGQVSMLLGLVMLASMTWIKLLRPVWPFIASMFHH